MQVTVTYLVVGLIVGFALGLGAGWFFWHGRHTARQEEEEPQRTERVQRRPAARYPRSYEPSTPPQHRPTPRPRPVTALHPANPIPPEVRLATRPAPAPRPALDVAPVPAPVEAEPEVEFVPPVRPAAVEPEPEPRPEPQAESNFEFRPAPEQRPVPVDQQPPDRELLHNLLETNRRLTADAELRLQRGGGAPVERTETREPAPVRPQVTAPNDNDLLARHRKLEEDSRRMSRRAD